MTENSISQNLLNINSKIGKFKLSILTRSNRKIQKIHVAKYDKIQINYLKIHATKADEIYCKYLKILTAMFLTINLNIINLSREVR